jgi:hypothetical protein
MFISILIILIIIMEMVIMNVQTTVQVCAAV